MTTTGTIAIRSAKAPILYQGRNGNISRRLRTDGSMVMAWRGEASPDWPMSIDVKVTNSCDRGCEYCHESSTDNGHHGDLWQLSEYLAPLPPGTELAIGGGDPLAHPDLESFLLREWKVGHVCNVTVHQGHAWSAGEPLSWLALGGAEILASLVKRRLVLAVGVSVDPRDPKPIRWLEDATGNVVYHVIAGVHNPRRLEGFKRILILGYKRQGRGARRGGKEIDPMLGAWRALLPEIVATREVGFDSLAVEQLEVERLATPREWNRHYLGRDGEMTMFVDGVTGCCAASSIHPRIPWTTVREDFQRIRSEVCGGH